MTFTAIASVFFIGLLAVWRRRPSPPDADTDTDTEEDMLDWAMRISAQPPPAPTVEPPAQHWLQRAAFSVLGATLGEALVAPSLRIADSMAMRLDSVANTLTGIGTAIDKGQAGRPDLTRLPLSRTELTKLYSTNGYAARFVDIVPDDATRKGWTVTSDDEDDGVDIMAEWSDVWKD